MKVEIVLDDTEKVREDRHGRDRISRLRKWRVLVDGHLDSEHDIQQDAIRRAEYITGGEWMKSCRYSGSVHDDYFHERNYPYGLPAVECPECGARRRLVVVDYSYARGAVKSRRVIYPYHPRKRSR